MQRKQIHPIHRGKQGFSLIELLVAVSIMLILGTIVGVNLMREPGKARRAAARAQIERLRLAVQMYANENGVIPTERQGLEALIRKPETPPVPAHYPSRGGYLESSALPRDPWGNPYVYLSPGRNGERFEIVSYGVDGIPEGEDEAADISSSDTL